MAYMSEDGKHDGWAAAEFADGRVSVGWDGIKGGVMVVREPNLGADYDREFDVVDGREAIGWRGICGCGWRGPLWQRVDDPAAHLAGHRVHASGLDRFGSAPGKVEEAIHAEWKGHLEPETITALRTATEEAWSAQGRLNAAVARARRDGRSWTEIGRAVGISRQSAHTRWAHLIDDDADTEA